MTRQGNPLQTYTGRQFWPLDPRADEIDIRDIAHALAMQCRFAGHCERFYSVAEHSFLLSRFAADEHALWALLHDASEAYLVDVPRPIKPFLTGYSRMEDRLMTAVCERFGLPPKMPEVVKQADRAILTDEAAQNMKRAPVAWQTETEPLGIRLMFMSPEQAERKFLDRFFYLSSR